MTSMIPLVTVDGVAAAFAANNSGVAITITSVALGNGGNPDGPSRDATSLVSECQRIAIASAERPSSQEIALSAIVPADDDGPEYWINEIGFYLADGTLFAVWSGAPMAYRQQGVDLMLTFTLALVTVPGDAVTVQAGTPSATLSVAGALAEMAAEIIRLQTMIIDYKMGV